MSETSTTTALGAGRCFNSVPAHIRMSHSFWLRHVLRHNCTMFLLFRVPSAPEDLCTLGLGKRASVTATE